MYASTSPLFSGTRTTARERAMDRLLFSNLLHLALRGYGSYMWSASMAVDPYFENRALALIEKLNANSAGYVRDKAQEILEKAGLHALHDQSKSFMNGLTEEQDAVLREVHALATELDAARLAPAAALMHSYRTRGTN